MINNNNDHTENTSSPLSVRSAMEGSDSKSSSTTNDGSDTFTPKRKRKIPFRMIAGALVLVLLVLGGTAGYLLTLTNQDLRQQARVGDTIYDGDPGTVTLCAAQPDHPSCTGPGGFIDPVETVGSDSDLIQAQQATTIADSCASGGGNKAACAQVSVAIANQVDDSASDADLQSLGGRIITCIEAGTCLPDASGNIDTALMENIINAEYFNDVVTGYGDNMTTEKIERYEQCINGGNSISTCFTRVGLVATDCTASSTTGCVISDAVLLQDQEQALDKCLYAIKATGLCYNTPTSAAERSEDVIGQNGDGVMQLIGGNNSQVCLDADGCQCANGGFTVTNGTCAKNSSSGYQLYGNGVSCTSDFQCASAVCNGLGECSSVNSSVGDDNATITVDDVPETNCQYGTTGYRCNQGPRDAQEFVDLAGYLTAACSDDNGTISCIGDNCADGSACGSGLTCVSGSCAQASTVGTGGNAGEGIFWGGPCRLPRAGDGGFCCTGGCCEMGDGYFAVEFTSNNSGGSFNFVGQSGTIDNGQVVHSGAGSVCLSSPGCFSQIDIFQGSPDNFSTEGPGAFYGDGYARTGAWTGSNGSSACGAAPAITPETVVPDTTPDSSDGGGGGGGFTPPSDSYFCNSSCSSDADCQTADSRFVCDAAAGNRCRLSSNPTSEQCQPPVGPMCISITLNNVTNPSAGTNDPELGDAITLTCGEVAGADHYVFRMIEPDGTVVDLAATGRTSESYTIEQEGNFAGQCQICTGADDSTCLPYEDPYNQ